MNLEEYTDNVMRTVNVLNTPLMNQLHMVLGMVTEASEIANVFKAKLAYNRNIDWVNIEEELGDILFFIFAFCRMNQIDLEKVMEQNIAKLKARYPEKYSDDKANNRNLDQERKVLEGLDKSIKDNAPIWEQLALETK